VSGRPGPSHRHRGPSAAARHSTEPSRRRGTPWGPANAGAEGSGTQADEGRPARTLADAIAPGRHDTTLHFPGERKSATLGELWEASRPVAGWFAARGTAPVAMVLSNTLSCATVLLGAIATGARVVSIPPPLAVVEPARYARFVAEACAQSGATGLVVDASYLSRLPPLPEVTYFSFDEVLRARMKGRRHPADFELIQYTAGGTGDPRGVSLDQGRIVAGVDAIVEMLSPEPGDGVCSWFPVSHAMGLVGMFLSGLVGCGPRWADGGDIVLLTPEMFRRRPAVWLEACAEYRSSITGSAPNFGFEVAMRRRPVHSLDLSRIRVCITGSEPLRARTLMDFTAAFRENGLAARALCPAYGVAECSLITAMQPGRGWNVLTVDPRALAERRVVPDAVGTPVVSCGQPLPGYRTRIESGGHVGEIAVSAPTLADHYADGTPVARPDGWLATGDLGFEVEGALYVLGRMGDLLEVGGHRYYAVELENRIGSLTGIRMGRVAVTDSDDGALCVAAELSGGEPDAGDRDGLGETVRSLVRSRTGKEPQVVLVERGRLPLDLGGRVQRHRVRAALAEGSLSPRRPR
jgi:acyl-CoA synthetase (AMP-forming)/AMP-acid ligase II